MNRVYGIFRYDKTGYRVGKRDIKAKKNWRGKGYLEHQPPNGASVSTLSMICFDEDFESVKLIRFIIYLKAQLSTSHKQRCLWNILGIKNILFWYRFQWLLHFKCLQLQHFGHILGLGSQGLAQPVRLF